MKNKVAISFQSCDKTELSKLSLKPLISQDFDLFWCDGSKTERGRNFFETKPGDFYRRGNVRGGAGAAYVYALTEMLKGDYTHVGLVENDCLITAADWFPATMALFELGARDGIPVGAVTARTYDDRILIQRDAYAILHNAGAGMVIFTREAARLALDHLRTAYTLDNRRIFTLLSGIDIGRYWAFRGAEHRLVADWHWDAMLAANGYATLGLVPSPTDMIGQEPPLDKQGLRISDQPVEARRNDDAFASYQHCLNAVRLGALKVPIETQFEFDHDTGMWTYFPHQLHMLGGTYNGDWTFKEMRGWGTFIWIAGDNASITLPAFGNVNIVVSGGKSGGIVEAYDTQSHFKIAPQIGPEGEATQIMSINMPATNVYRELKITFNNPGTCFYGVQSRDRQATLPHKCWFDHAILPDPA